MCKRHRFVFQHLLPSQNGALSHDRRVLRLKEKSLAFCHPLNVFCSLSRGFRLFLLFSLFGHVSRIWGLVGVAVDSPVYELLVGAMDAYLPEPGSVD